MRTIVTVGAFMALLVAVIFEFKLWRMWAAKLQSVEDDPIIPDDDIEQKKVFFCPGCLVNRARPHQVYVDEVYGYAPVPGVEKCLECSHCPDCCTCKFCKSCKLLLSSTQSGIINSSCDKCLDCDACCKCDKCEDGTIALHKVVDPCPACGHCSNECCNCLVCGNDTVNVTQVLDEDGCKKKFIRPDECSACFSCPDCCKCMPCAHCDKSRFPGDQCETCKRCKGEKAAECSKPCNCFECPECNTTKEDAADHKCVRCNKCDTCCIEEVCSEPNCDVRFCKDKKCENCTRCSGHCKCIECKKCVQEHKNSDINHKMVGLAEVEYAKHSSRAWAYECELCHNCNTCCDCLECGTCDKEFLATTECEGCNDCPDCCKCEVCGHVSDEVGQPLISCTTRYCEDADTGCAVCKRCNEHCNCVPCTGVVSGCMGRNIRKDLSCPTCSKCMEKHCKCVVCITCKARKLVGVICKYCGVCLGCCLCVKARCGHFIKTENLCTLCSTCCAVPGRQQCCTCPRPVLARKTIAEELAGALATPITQTQQEEKEPELDPICVWKVECIPQNVDDQAVNVVVDDGVDDCFTTTTLTQGAAACVDIPLNSGMSVKLIQGTSNMGSVLSHKFTPPPRTHTSKCVKCKVVYGSDELLCQACSHCIHCHP